MSAGRSRAAAPRPAGSGADAGPAGHPRVDVLLLGLGIAGVSLSGPLIAVTAAPALAIAFWRNALAAASLLAVALARATLRAELATLLRGARAPGAAPPTPARRPASTTDGGRASTTTRAPDGTSAAGLPGSPVHSGPEDTPGLADFTATGTAAGLPASTTDSTPERPAPSATSAGLPGSPVHSGPEDTPGLADGVDRWALPERGRGLSPRHVPAAGQAPSGAPGRGSGPTARLTPPVSDDPGPGPDTSPSGRLGDPTAREGREALGPSLVAGGALALHFGLWLPSVGLTSVASSVALVTTTPVWTTLLLRLRGHRPAPRVWVGGLVAFTGVLLLTGVDLTVSGRALAGDALALGGGIAMAVYVLAGAEARRTLSTTSYTLVCYGTASVGLLAACLVAGASLGAGYSAETWLKLLALTVAAQFLGHSLLNRVVRGLGPSIVATSVLLETPGAALLAAVWLGQLPPPAAYPALALILLGLALVVRGERGAR